MVEIKANPAEPTHVAIRNALGQILEYNLYPGRQAKDFWIILVANEPSRGDREFLRVVNSRLAARIGLVWFDGESLHLR
jgi:hypothetical protein